MNPLAILTAYASCRISGLSIDALVTSAANSFNNYVDAVNVADQKAAIDGYTQLIHGYYNLFATGCIGMQLGDAQYTESWSDNVHVECPNVRIRGGVYTAAGKDFVAESPPPTRAGIYFSGDDLTLTAGLVQQAEGPGVMLDGATNTSILGMYIDSNGQDASGDSPGILINSSQAAPAHTISICANHFHENDNGNGTATAQIRFAGPASGAGSADGITLCGNVYLVYNRGVGGAYPDYVYDVTGMPPTHLSLYEQPVAQQTGIFSPGAAAAMLPQQQALPGNNYNHLTGLALSNDSGNPNVKVDIGAGQAMDSTNSAVITLLEPCSVGLNAGEGPGGIDISNTGSANTTYFYFVISGPTVIAPNCIASASITPSFANAPGYTLFRMVGALYTDSSAHVVQFVQSGDTFTLQTSVRFAPTLASTSLPVGIPSVPAFVSVEAFGRCAASAAVNLSAGNVPAQTPSAIFSTTPGYMENAPAPNTPFPFALYTVGGTGTPPLAPGGSINAAAAASGTNLTCYNDGWVWQRGK